MMKYCFLNDLYAPTAQQTISLPQSGVPKTTLLPLGNYFDKKS